MVLLKAERAQAALVAANEAVEHAETIAARLNSSLDLLRGRRDELVQKMRSDTAAALIHQRADPQTMVPAQPAPPRRVWKFL
jgi:hypothetical protein